MWPASVTSHETPGLVQPTQRSCVVVSRSGMGLIVLDILGTYAERRRRRHRIPTTDDRAVGREDLSEKVLQ